jgi:hypothetical protein
MVNNNGRILFQHDRLLLIKFLLPLAFSAGEREAQFVTKPNPSDAIFNYGCGNLVNLVKLSTKPCRCIGVLFGLRTLISDYTAR